MCGIAGIFSLSGKPIQNAEERIQRMTMMLKHRGPDNQAIYVSNDRIVALGNTRLAIVDPACELKQPLTTSDNQLVLSFNGEIYNYVDLRKELEQKGIGFRSRMDTEVLLEGLRLEGEAFLQQLDGMWAFAYYNTEQRRLLISRDLMGERHLFYRKTNDFLVFASEVAPILADSNDSFNLDFESFIVSLQYFAAPPGRSMVEGVSRLLPGHNLTAKTGEKLNLSRYRRLHPEKWFDFFKKDSSLETGIKIFEEVFHRSCKRRVPLEVPYMCTLSGGIDSALSTTYTSDCGRKRINTVYGQSADLINLQKADELDERSASIFTAGKLNSNHSTVFLNTEDIIPVITHLVENSFDGLYDSGTASYEMMAAYTHEQNTKVIIITEGPDEVLGGYPKDLNAYKMDLRRSQHPIRYQLLKQISSHIKGRKFLKKFGRKDLIVNPLTSDDPFRFQPINQSWGPDFMSQFLPWEQIDSSSNYYGGLDSVYNDIIPELDYAQKRALSYASFSLPDMFNLRIDKAYMKRSVEARLPYQAIDMIELMIAMPTAFRFNGGTTTKYIMREIVNKRIGPEIAYRSKYGFGETIWNIPKVMSAMNYADVIRESLIFESFPFKKGTREFVLNPKNEDALWPFFVLAKTCERLRNRKYKNYNSK
jgi:asparagine synthase (glutamine-hydrolysing)